MKKYFDLAEIEKKKIFLMCFFLIILGLLEIFSLGALIPILQLVLDEKAFFDSQYFEIINNHTSFFLSDNETQSQRGGARPRCQQVFFTILQLGTIHLAHACLVACNLSTLPEVFP